MTADEKVRDEANLAALAFMRKAIEYSEATEPTGSVLEDLAPYFQRLIPVMDPDGEGEFDAAPALYALIAALAQMAAVNFHRVMELEAGQELTVPELLDKLDEFEARFVMDPEGGQAT